MNRTVASLADLAWRLNWRRRRLPVAGTGDKAFPPLILMTDSLRLPDPLAAVASLPAGSAVILRHYEAPGRQDLARELAVLCRRRRIRLLIGGDARLAYAVGADGLHLPEWLARRGPGKWRRWRRADWIVTAAVHSPASLFRAAGAGADAALLSPVFATVSHPDVRMLGPLKFTAWCRLSPLPVYALGGISTANVRRLKDCGNVGFAGIGGFSEDSKRRSVRVPVKSL